ncbi:MAG: hypothetical protein RMX96_12415, partial [Nostoc sp. ChiSLP02]|nr:hypothetical protein [Nostoc sp. ChiSLP02]
MTKPKILQEEREYTFRSYFEMTYPPEEILAELGYKLIRSRLSLPKTQKTLDRLSDLQERIERTLTRREFDETKKSQEAEQVNLL